MPVAPTYPGVYIEEVPSGVHTVTGVSTSITAFIGYTMRGSVDEPIHIFSFADFERAFGGLDSASPLSHCVKHFFQNGGTEAYVVRVAQNAKAAAVTLRNASIGVLDVAASSEGTWGNSLQLDVDYDTSNPASLFNLRVTEYVDRNGAMVPGRTEMFRNLTLNSADPNYAVALVNAQSQLVELKPASTLAFSSSGTSTSGVLTLPEVTSLPVGYRVAYRLNGEGPFEVTIATPTPPAGATLEDALNAVASDIATAIQAKSPPGVTGALTPAKDALLFTAVVDAGHPAERSSIQFLDASTNSVTARLKLGQANGGTEADAAALVRPLPSGTSATFASLPLSTPGAFTLDVMKEPSATPVVAGISVPAWGGTSTRPTPATFDEAVAHINAALTELALIQPLLKGATAQRSGNAIRVLPGPTDPNISFRISTGGTTPFTATTPNVGHYAPGVGVTALAQVSGTIGNNGIAPTGADLIGNEATKKGLYALEDVDLFNILVIPEASAGPGFMNVLTEGIAYCARRRAFMIIDTPETIKTFAAAQAWMSSVASPLRSRNSAIYFPRLKAPDPTKNGIIAQFPAAGALAGLYARTDAERGVWKAPAGTTATIVGATGLSYTLTDRENGTLNPLALNALRVFPVIGTVSWGARTGRGADVLSDEYKYIPVRRLALFLEESLYRGSQWVVFEPNDEPLWSQIRLNLGAFMHTLFSQGAFQGRTPRDAYFVKCDKETTTPNDIDLGRVNIVVGFAPLKPAEFVIIQIQQIVPALQT
ncbi:MAG TPA: phage tail sheath C-terminal domain-containing protein [Gemmatimonadaceae bacterium]|nr:phage tail sheath C-terminal domain-containing protein [Gemmatimonadaceae bacterium]